MKPNREFDFTVAELALVENAMHYRTRKLISRRETVKKETSRIAIDSEVKAIQTLLAKIHDQKIWLNPGGF